MSIPRITIRRMMVFVALVALVCYGESMRRRTVFYRRQARLCSDFEQMHLKSIERSHVIILSFRNKIAWYDGRANIATFNPAGEIKYQILAEEKQVQDYTAIVEAYARKRKLYEDVASHPWLWRQAEPLGPE